MRVEINFSGDSSEAVISSEEVTKAVRKLFVQAEETAQAVQEIRISSAQAAESSAAARRMANDIQQIGQEARKSRREIEALKLSGAGTRNPGSGVGPFGSGFGRVGVLGAAVGLGVATSGPLGGGAAALGLGALGLSGGALGAVGVLVASFQGLGKAIEGDRQAFEKLSPPTQQFVQDVRSLIPWLKDLQESARAGLLPGIDKGLHEFLNPQTAGAIQQTVRGISSELGKLAEQAGRGLGGPAFQQFLSDAGTHGVTQLDNLGHAAGHFADALLVLDHAGQPLTDWLTKAVDEGARFVDEYLRAADASGALGEKLGGARHELELVGHLVGALVEAAGQLAIDLTPLGNRIIVDLTVALQDLAHWLDQNHDKVVEITGGALTALENTVRILAPLVSDLAKNLDQVAQAVGGWDTAFEIVIGGVLLKSLLGIGAAAGEEGAAGKVGLLTSRLKGLSSLQIAPIIIGVDLAVTKAAHDFIKQHLGKYAAAAFAILGSTATGGLSGGLAAGDLFGGGGKSGGKFDYPLASTGKLIGTPFQGTHGKAFNQAGGSDNWESENAVDIAVKQGTPVVAVEDGVIGQQIGSLGMGGRFAGLRLHLLGDSGNEYYYAHLSTILVKAGQRVKKGDPLGMSGSANGVAHLHFAQKSGNPQSTISGAALAGGLSAPTIAGAAASGATGSAGTSGSAFGAAPPFTGGSKVDLLPAALRLAMAKAGTTPGTGDDRTSIGAAVTWLKANVGGFTGEDQINAYLELASLLGQLKTLGKKTASGVASKASRISAQGTAAGLISALGGQTPLFSSEGPQYASAAYAHNAPFATKGSYTTKLSDEDEARFRAWLQKYKVPFDPDDPRSDYDMRGYWKANHGKAYKGGHFPDTYKTPYDTTFSAESKYATANNPFKWQGNNLVDTRSGRLIFGKGGGGVDSVVNSMYGTATTSDPAANLAQAVAHLKAVRQALLPEIQAISTEIGEKTLSAKTLAVLRAQMGQYKKTITTAVTDVKTAIQNQKTGFQQAWQNLADAAVASLEEQRGNYKSPARILLDTLTATHDTAALNDALDQANKDLATALKGHQADAQAQLDSIRQYVGTSFLVNALDAAQSAILGGTSQQISGQSILDTLHGLLAGGNVVDPDEVKTAQKAVEDAKYNIQIAGLEKTATAEEKAYNDSIDLQEKAIQTLSANWETYFQALHGNIAAIPGWWVSMLNQMGLTDTATAIAGDASVGGSPSLALQNAHQQALSGAIDAAQYQYLISGHKLEIPGFAGGGDFITTGPTPIMVGEGGAPERVRITPAHGGGAGAGNEPITVIIQTRDEALADFIDVRVEGASPKISRQIGVLANRRQRANGGG
jgi:murein DD-endopeptidase MepM/ murein hydrolase activator NlpD